MKYNFTKIMKNIKLDAEQINELLTKQHVQVGNSHIEFVENKLVINKKGLISKIQSLELSYDNKDFECEQLIIIFQKRVCKHLNLEPEQVLYHSGITPQDIVFRIKVVPNKDLALVVCSHTQAILNSSELDEQKVSRDYDAEQIGLYKRLGDSSSYFRWLDDFI